MSTPTPSPWGPDVRGASSNSPPPEATDKAYQLGPKQTKVVLLGRHSAALAALHQTEFSDVRSFQPRRGIPVEWLTACQQKHVQKQGMSCISTMLEHSRRWDKRGFFWSPDCLICGLRDTGARNVHPVTSTRSAGTRNV